MVSFILYRKRLAGKVIRLIMRRKLCLRDLTLCILNFDMDALALTQAIGNEQTIALMLTHNLYLYRIRRIAIVWVDVSVALFYVAEISCRRPATTYCPLKKMA